jgi:hypothetical protein
MKKKLIWQCLPPPRDCEKRRRLPTIVMDWTLCISPAYNHLRGIASIELIPAVNQGNILLAVRIPQDRRAGGSGHYRRDLHPDWQCHYPLHWRWKGTKGFLWCVLYAGQGQKIIWFFSHDIKKKFWLILMWNIQTIQQWWQKNES